MSETIQQEAERQSAERNFTRDHFIDLGKLAEEIAEKFPTRRKEVIFAKMLDHILSVERMTVDMQMRAAAMQSMRQPTIVEAAGPIPKQVQQ